MTIHITAVVNAHREGLLANASLASLARAKSCAESQGLSVEALAVLDNADALTTAVFDNFHGAELRILHVNCGDLGKARNEGVLAASGEWIAFLDADDLWGANWLSSALEAASRDSRNIIWHPEINVYFGEAHHIFPHIDMESQDFNPLVLYYANYWTALCMARRKFCIELPYCGVDIESGIGYEDWHWNTESIGRGAIHKIVKGTGHAIRVRGDSLLRRTNFLQAIPTPDRGFRDFTLAVMAGRVRGGGNQ